MTLRDLHLRIALAAPLWALIARRYCAVTVTGGWGDVIAPSQLNATLRVSSGHSVKCPHGDIRLCSVD